MPREDANLALARSDSVGRRLSADITREGEAAVRGLERRLPPSTTTCGEAPGRRSRHRWVAVALAGALLGPVACGGEEEGGGGEPAPVAKGGVLRIAQISDPTTLDQMKMVDNESVRVVSQITEPLYKTNARGNPAPWLASGHEVSDDGRRWTFTLRPGVRFSTGRELTAKDVVFTLRQSRKSEQWGFILANVKSVRAAGDDTVVITTKAPSASMLADVALFANGIIPAGYGGASAEAFADEPIGTGPFALEQWDKGTRVVLQRNPDYWRGEPVLDAVEFVAVADDNSRAAQLRGGQLDVIAQPAWPQLAGLERDPELGVGEYALARVDCILLNSKRAPLDDPRVREAFSVAIDRAATVKASLQGHGEPGKSFLAPSVPYYAAGLPEPSRDLARARELVKAAGAEGATIELLVPAGDSTAATMSQVVQQNVQEAGLTVKLRPLDQSTVLARAQGGDYAAAVTSLTSDVQDPSELTGLYAGTNGLFTGVDTSAVAELGEQGTQTTDPTERERVYEEVQRTVVGDFGFIPVQYEPWVYGLSDRVAGFTVNATGIYDLAEVGLRE